MAIVDWVLHWYLKSPERLLSFTERLRKEGRSSEALFLIESASGISPEDYDQPSRALQNFRRWAREFDGKLQYLLFGRWLTLLADTPGPVDRLELVSRLWELDTGLDPRSYSDPEVIRQRLQQRVELAGFDSRLSFHHASRLAASLGLAGRVADEVAVLEAVLDLDSEDYFDDSKLARLLRLRPRGVVPDLRVLCLPGLVTALGKLGRRSEGAAVFVAAIGLSSDDLQDPERVLVRVRKVAQEPPFGFLLLTILPTVIREAGGGRAGLGALELDLDWSDDRYSDKERLAARLRNRWSDLPPDITYFYLQSLVVGLSDEGNIIHAISLLAADLGIPASDFSDTEKLATFLQDRCRVLPANVSSFYVWLVAYVLVSADRPRAAAKLIELDSGLQAVDWNDRSALANSLTARFAGLSVQTSVILIDELATALAENGNEERAAMLVDAYLLVPYLAGGADEGISLVRWRCRMVTRWLAWWGQDQGKAPVDFCRTLLPYLRRSMAGRGKTLQDRGDFTHEVGDLRRRIVQAGLYWASRETDQERASEALREVFLWDLELAQRLLLERFLLTEIVTLPAGRAPVSGKWPFRDADQPSGPIYLPEHQEIFRTLGALEKVS